MWVSLVVKTLLPASHDIEHAQNIILSTYGFTRPVRFSCSFQGFWRNKNKSGGQLKENL